MSEIPYPVEIVYSMDWTIVKQHLAWAKGPPSCHVIGIIGDISIIVTIFTLRNIGTCAKLSESDYS